MKRIVREERHIWCHNDLGLERVVNFVLGKVDAQNIFDGLSLEDYPQFEDNLLSLPQCRAQGSLLDRYRLVPVRPCQSLLPGCGTSGNRLLAGCPQAGTVLHHQRTPCFTSG